MVDLGTRKVRKTATNASVIRGIKDAPLTAKEEIATAYSELLTRNITGPIPQLINIDIVCDILDIGKSAVYELVAKGLLEPPCKLSPGRRGAARWLLSSVVKFIEELAAQRDLSVMKTND